MNSFSFKSFAENLGIRIVPNSNLRLLRSGDAVLGEKIIVAGYPFGRIISGAIKITAGVVSATRGLSDDTGQFQFDAAVQPGSSGGPIFDKSGNVIGIVVAGIAKNRIAKAFGAVPELSNFGIKASVVNKFLKSRGLPIYGSDANKVVSTEKIAEFAKRQTLMVSCSQ